MKKILVILLVCVMILTGCVSTETNNSESTDISSNSEISTFKELEDEMINFDNLNDPALLQYIEDSIYADLVYRFDSEDYIVEDVGTVYISKEYLEELEYNSKENIYFGYTLSEIDAQFEGTRYVFSLGEDGTTVVQEFEKYDNTYEQVIKNVAIGTGVILVCVTVSVVTGGVGTGTISAVFAASAKTGTSFALSTGVISGVSSGIVTQFQTGDFNETIKSAALSGSEGFKWGAITGVVAGGTSKVFTFHKAAKRIPTPRESELRALNKYGGNEQLSFLNGKEVSMATKNATRPDVVRYNKGILEAIEVKNYNLNSSTNRNALYKELERQISNRVVNLPKGSTQRIALDVKGRGYSDEMIQNVVNNIKTKCSDVYPDIPIDILR